MGEGDFEFFETFSQGPVAESFERFVGEVIELFSGDPVVGSLFEECEGVGDGAVEVEDEGGFRSHGFIMT